MLPKGGINYLAYGLFLISGTLSLIAHVRFAASREGDDYKSQIRILNPKQSLILNSQSDTISWYLERLDLFRISILGFRISKG